MGKECVNGIPVVVVLKTWSLTNVKCYVWKHPMPINIPSIKDRPWITWISAVLHVSAYGEKKCYIMMILGLGQKRWSWSNWQDMHEEEGEIIGWFGSHLGHRLKTWEVFFPDSTVRGTPSISVLSWRRIEEPRSSLQRLMNPNCMNAWVS